MLGDPDLLVELLYGVPGRTYRGLLSSPNAVKPLPPGTMTRQRHRAEARAAAKARL